MHAVILQQEVYCSHGACVCVCVLVCVCAHVYAHVCVHVRMYTCVYVCKGKLTRQPRAPSMRTRDHIIEQQ